MAGMGRNRTLAQATLERPLWGKLPPTLHDRDRRIADTPALRLLWPNADCPLSGTKPAFLPLVPMSAFDPIADIEAAAGVGQTIDQSAGMVSCR
jgi:hypothetical protein